MPRVPGEQASPKSAGSEDPSHFLTWGVDTTGSEDGEDSRDANRLTEVCECRLSRHRHVLRLCERCADREISILLKAEKFGLDHHDSSQCEIKDFTCGREMKAVAPRRGTPAPRAASQETQGGTGAAEGRVDGPRGCRPRSGADHAGVVIPDALGDFYFESHTGFRNTENWRNSAPASGELTVQSSRGRRCVSGGRSFRRVRRWPAQVRAPRPRRPPAGATPRSCHRTRTGCAAATHGHCRTGAICAFCPRCAKHLPVMAAAASGCAFRWLTLQGPHSHGRRTIGQLYAMRPHRPSREAMVRNWGTLGNVWRRLSVPAGDSYEQRASRDQGHRLTAYDVQDTARHAGRPGRGRPQRSD